jgi:hypothetical protein
VVEALQSLRFERGAIQAQGKRKRKAKFSLKNTLLLSSILVDVGGQK